MTLDEIKNTWTSTGDKLTRISAETLSGLNLHPDTIKFLTTVGLPKEAAPFLDFAKDKNYDYDGINTLSKHYELEPPEDFERFIVIGSCGDGDVIAIDTKDKDKIVRLDHEDYFSSRFFNSSITTLISCLIAYRDFVRAVIKDNGEDAFIESNFNDDHFNSLKNKISTVDNRALIEDGFWKAQLLMDLAMREDARRKPDSEDL